MLRAYARTGVDPISLDSEVPAERLDAHLQRQALSHALAELRPVEREVLLLHAWAQLSDAEVASALSLPVGTVKSRLSRARAQVRNHLRSVGQLEVDKLTTVEERQS